MDGRKVRSDRLYYYEKKAFGGVEIHPDPRVSISATAGFAFDRYYFEGKHFWESDFNRVNISDGPYAAINLKILFAPLRSFQRKPGSQETAQMDQDSSREINQFID